jgi:DNA-binding NarL/FixJ family response regulator
MRTLRILIADDHAAVRRAIWSLLESETEWRICGEASDGVEAVEMAGRLRPDVVLLDMTMPGLSGLEAARQIRQNVPEAQVVVLTTHALDVLEEEFRRAGARAIISKPDADRSLIPAIETVRPRRGPVHLAGSVVGRHRHIAAFFHSDEERYRVLGPFIAEGLQHEEKALHIIDPPNRGVHIAHLREQGIDAARAEARGQLELVPWDKAYLRGGHFDQRAMLALIREFVDGGAPQGYPLTRLIAHMEWASEDSPGVADLVEYETRLNDVLEDYDDIVICAYDVPRFPAAIITDVMRRHPAVIIDGSLQHNSLYSPPPSSP